MEAQHAQVRSALFLIATTSEHDNRLKMVLLVTSDNEQFVVDKDVAERSVLIKHMLEGKPHGDSDNLSLIAKQRVFHLKMLEKATNLFPCPMSRLAS